MVVAPVNNVNLKSYRSNVHFGHRVEDDEQDRVQHTPKKASNLVKVPVIVMMAMSPAMLNGIASAEAQNNNLERTELLAMASPAQAPQRSSSTQNNYAYGWSGIKTHQVRFAKDIVANGTGYKMVYTAHNNKNTAPKLVEYVYLIKNGTSCSQPGAFPPEVKALVYHKLGKDEFCGVRVREGIRKKDGTLTGEMEREIKLKDDDANLLIKLLAGTSGWTNKSYIVLEETTSPNVMAPRVIKH